MAIWRQNEDYFMTFEGMFIDYLIYIEIPIIILLILAFIAFHFSSSKSVIKEDGIDNKKMKESMLFIKEQGLLLGE